MLLLTVNLFFDKEEPTYQFVFVGGSSFQDELNVAEDLKSICLLLIFLLLVSSLLFKFYHSSIHIEGADISFTQFLDVCSSIVSKIMARACISFRNETILPISWAVLVK